MQTTKKAEKVAPSEYGKGSASTSAAEERVPLGSAAEESVNPAAEGQSKGALAKKKMKKKKVKVAVTAVNAERAIRTKGKPLCNRTIRTTPTESPSAVNQSEEASASVVPAAVDSLEASDPNVLNVNEEEEDALQPTKSLTSEPTKSFEA